MPPRLKQQDIELIIQLHLKTDANARKAERILSEEPYFSQNQDFARKTIVRYWKREGLQVRSRGGNYKNL